MLASSRWVLGVFLALLNAVLSSVGLTLQRYSALKDQKNLIQSPDGSSATWSCSPLWLLGVALYIIAAAPDVYAYLLIPQVVCTAIACFRVALVAVMACACLAEEIQIRQVLGMTVCSVGTFLCLTYGPRGQEGKSASASEFYHPSVVMYLLVGLILLAFFLVLEHADDLRFGFGISARFRCLLLPLCTGLAYGLEKCFNTELGFVKTPEHVLEHPKWLFMVAAIAMLGLTDFYLNLRGARLMAVQVFVPIAFAWCTVVQYFQSIVVFEEFKGMSALHITLSMAGAVFSLLGAIFIDRPSAGSTTKDNDPRSSDVSLQGFCGQGLIGEEEGEFSTSSPDS